MRHGWYLCGWMNMGLGDIEGMDLGGVGLGVDLLRGVLGVVDWRELASHVLEEEE